jgi:hypothetical protein
MTQLTLRAIGLVRSRIVRDDRGQATAEWLMLGVMVVGIIVALTARYTDIFNGVTDHIDSLMPG